MTTDTLVELTGFALKNNYLQFLDKELKQKWDTAKGKKFVPPFSILSMADIDERL